MKLSIVGSGSEGNSIVLTGSQHRIVIDCGFSQREFQHRCESTGIDVSGIDLLLLTHEHSDHIRGAGVLARRFGCSVVATEHTLRRGRAILGNLSKVRVMSPGETLLLGEMRIDSFSIPHDASDPVGYIVQSDGVKIGICTDLGCITPVVQEKLTGCHGLVLEMNHDVNMLMAGSYPWELKQRIRSRLGHLSNDDTANFLPGIWHAGLSHLVLAHLSKENNLPELAQVVAEHALASIDPLRMTRVIVAQQDEAMHSFDVVRPLECRTVQTSMPLLFDTTPF